ncbi:MAG: CoA-binding protein [Candidatus Micrarchaeia archaeon]
MKNLDCIFSPKSVAIIGASRKLNKIGNVITKNFIDGGYEGDIYPVNPQADEILGLKCYPSVLDIPRSVDCAVVVIPAPSVPKVLKECGEKGVKGAVVISGGFSEIGNHELERELVDVAERYGVHVIGPNCMGVLNPRSHVDSIFLPMYKLGRPRVGEIGFISQSGAIGGCIVDLCARAGVGMSKFVSYGNASVIDEADLLEYLAYDKETQIIEVYIEGVKRGRKFMDILKEITKIKPVVILKGGVTKRGAEATMSHTASLAGSAEVYRAVFKQCKAVEAHSLEELFDFAKIFYQPKCRGKRIGIITNGGGTGILAADSIERNGLELAEFSDKTKNELRQKLPEYTNVRNPLDIAGDADADRYQAAIETVIEDENTDFLVIIVLFQTAAIDSRIIETIVRANEIRKKPIVAIATGGEYTEFHKRILDSYGVPTYSTPSAAMRAVAEFVNYSMFVMNSRRG